MSNDAYHNMMEGDKADLHDAWEARQEEKWRSQLIHEGVKDIKRFPLPICFDAYEERKQLNLRTRRIEELIDRFLQMNRYKFNKKYRPHLLQSQNKDTCNG